MRKDLSAVSGCRSETGETAFAASSLKTTLPALTGVRGIAAWWVVVYHFRDVIPGFANGGGSRYLNRGYLAVDLFFVLSGFIISMNYLPGLGGFSLRTYLRFLALRLGRIYPLHLFMMLVFLLNPLAIVLLSHDHEPGARYDAVYYALSLLLVQNWGFTHDLAWNVPAWSISTEWFVYLVFPLIAVMSRAASSRWLAVAGIAICLLVLNVVIQMVGEDVPENGLARCLLEFVSGSLTYMVWRNRRADRRLSSELAFFSSLLLMAAVFSDLVPQFPIAALAWCCLIFGLANRRGSVSRVCCSHVVLIIGEYSYSTYLCHYFIRDWIKFLLVGKDVQWQISIGAYVATTALASVIFYHFVEVPGRRFVRRLLDRSSLRSSPAVPAATSL